MAGKRTRRRRGNPRGRALGFNGQSAAAKSSSSTKSASQSASVPSAPSASAPSASQS